MLVSQLVVGAQARADEVQIPPWEQGVSDQDRASALEAFRQGNAHFTEAEYALAARLYRQALEHWDHPRIHGNLATALIHLDEPVEAMQHLEEALRYGPTPFEANVYSQLLTNHKLLTAQLSRIVVSCDLPGAEVTVDGKPLFVGPGTEELLTTAGAHEVAAKKAGHLTESRSVQAAGGKRHEVQLMPVALAEVAKRERRWAPWKPWAVVGGGALVTLTGIPLGRASVRARDRYESSQLTQCPAGCTDAQLADLSYHRDRARMWNGLEIGAYVVGSAALIAGGVLVYINREHTVEFDEEGHRIAVIPLLGAATTGVALETRF